MKKYLFLFLLMLLPGVAWADDVEGHVVIDATEGASDAQKAGVYIISTTPGTVKFVGVTSSSVTEVYVPKTITANGGKPYNVISVGNKDSQTEAQNATDKGWISDTYKILNGNTSIKSITFEDGSLGFVIGKSAFEDCKYLESITLPSNLITIYSSAFIGCTNLKEVKLPTTPGLKTIREYAFQGCTSLASIEIPSTVTTVGTAAFKGCSGLKTLYYYSTSVPTDDSIFDGISDASVYSTIDGLLSGGPNAITSDGSRFTQQYIFNESKNCITRISGWGKGSRNASNTTGIFEPNASVVQNGSTVNLVAIGSGSAITISTDNSYVEVTVPDDMTTISEQAFMNSSLLKSITLPDGVEINASAFKGCTKLSKVNFGENGKGKVKSLGTDAFRGCTALEGELTITGSGNTEIGKTAFLNSKITKVTLSGFSTIGVGAFSHAASLESVDLGSVTKVMEDAFEYCTQLSTLKHDGPITEIGKQAFEECKALTEIDFTGDGTGDIGEGAFLGAGLISAKLTNYADLQTLAFENCTALKEIDFTGNGTGNIDLEAFKGCIGLISAKLTNYVDLQTDAFNGCTALNSVSLDVKTIEGNAFSGCNALKEVKIGSKVTKIGDNAFKDCTSSITSLTIEANEAPTAKSNSGSAFGPLALDTRFTGKLYYPSTGLGYDVQPWTCFTNKQKKTISFISDESLIYQADVKQGANVTVTKSEPDANGVITFTVKEDSENSTNTFTLTPPTGKKFSAWKSSEAVLTTDGDVTTFTMPDKAATLDAQFETNQVTTVSFKSNGSLLKEVSAKQNDVVKVTNKINTDGTVSVSVNVRNDNGESNDYSFTVTPPTGKKFSGWKSAEAVLTTDGDVTTFTMPDKAATLDAQFETNQVTTVSFKSNGSLLKEVSAKQNDVVKVTNKINTDGTVSVSVNVRNDNGESNDYSFTVTPPTGKKFSGWKSAEAVLTTDGDVTTFTMPDKAATLDAQFETNQVTTVSFKSNGSLLKEVSAKQNDVVKVTNKINTDGTVSVSVNVRNDNGESNDYSFTVTPPTGKKFSGWKSAEAVLTTDGDVTTFTMPDKAATLDAQFETNQVTTVSFKSNGSLLKEVSAKQNDVVKVTNKINTDGTVSVSVNVRNDNGESNDYSFTVTPPTGKKFSGWKSAEAVLTTDGDVTTFTMPDKAATLDAQFETNPLTVTFKTQYGENAPEDFGNTVDAAVNAEVSYPTPPAKDGYTFDKWIFKKTEGGSVVSDISNTPSGTGFLMPEYDLTAIATFKENTYTVTYMNGDTNTLIGTKSHKKSEEVTIENEEGISFTPADGKDCTWSSSDVAVKDGKFTMIGKDVTITATSTAKSHTIKYSYKDVNKDTKNKEDGNYNVGAKVSAPALATVAGYTAEWNFYKKFENGEYKEKVTDDLKWYDDGTFQMPDYDLYAYAEYEKAMYKITFVVKNGADKAEEVYETSYMDEKVEISKDAVLALDEIKNFLSPLKGKSSLTGWTSSDATLTVDDKLNISFVMPGKDVTITGVLKTESYTFTYIEINPLTQEPKETTTNVNYGSTVTLNDPATTIYTKEETKNGSTTTTVLVFNGWIIKDDNGNIFSDVSDDKKFKMPAYNLTATSDYENGKGVVNQYDLTLKVVPVNSTEADYLTTIKVYKGQTIKEVPALKKAINDYITAYNQKEENKVKLDGYTWDLSNNKAAVSGAPKTMPEKKLELYVIFIANTFKITYVYTMEGTNPVTLGTDSYSAGQTVTPRTPKTITGYTFSGWTSIPTTLSQDITVTGNYTRNEYILTFEVDGEEYSKTEDMHFGDAIKVPAAPVKSGYIFSGWQWPDIAPMPTMPASNLTVSGYFYQSEQKVTDNESGLAFDVAVTSMNGNTGSVTLTSLPEAVLKGEREIPSQISAAGKTYTVTKVNASAFSNLAEGVIVYLPQTAATTADVVNVVNNGSKVKTLDLTKVKKFALPSTVASVTANEVKYTRTITGTSTVVTMPYGVAVPKGFKAYTLKGANSQKKAQFEEYTGEKMAAYTPYLLVKQSGEVAGARALLADDAAAETETTIDLSAKNVTIVPEPENAAQGDDQMSLSGTVSAISNDRGYIFGMYKLQADGSWDMTAVENDPSEYIAPFSGYLTVTNQLIEGKVEGTTAVEPEPVDPTGINAVDAAADSNASNDVWYDMRGRRLQGEPTQKGIYIKNGKKFVKN